MLETCGTFIFAPDCSLLICRATSDNKNWSIPKGHKELLESYKEAAIRECVEETGIILDKKNLLHIGESVYNSKKKKIIGFVNLIPVDKKTKLQCNCFFNYKNKKLPEVDNYQWTYDYQIIHHAQISLYEKALKFFKEQNK